MKLNYLYKIFADTLPIKNIKFLLIKALEVTKRKDVSIRLLLVTGHTCIKDRNPP